MVIFSFLFSVISDGDTVVMETLTSASSDGDLVKMLNGTDVITANLSKMTETIEEDLSHMETENILIVEKDCDVIDEISRDDCDEERLQTANDSSFPEEKDTEQESSRNEEENLPASLIQELSPNSGGPEASAPKTENVSEENAPICDDTQKQSLDVTIDLDDLAIDRDDVMSFEDPVEVLINFFYTSHIKITSKNVDKLRSYAQQCGIADVTMACDAFDNLLQTETASLTTDQEKETMSTNIRLVTHQSF